MQPPPHDANGKVSPHDHPEIVNGDRLIRRISEQHIVGPQGARRVSTMAFQCSSDGSGMSVDIAKLIEQAGLDVAAFVTSQQWPYSVQFGADGLRGEGLKVGYYPLLQNPYHGAVWGITTRSQKNRLRRLAEWFVPGPNVALGEEA